MITTTTGISHILATDPLLVQMFEEENLTQYVLLREDLQTDGKPWNNGSLIAQACHACIAVNSLHKDHANVLRYTSESNLSVLRTVVLAAKSNLELLDCHDLLNRNKIENHLFIEQPENIPTCLATIPIQKSMIHSHIKHFKLFK